MYAVQLGAWVWNLACFAAALCLVFPDGLPPGHRRRIVCAAVACGVFVNAAVSFDPGSDRASAAVPHPVVVRLPGPVRALELVLAYAALLAERLGCPPCPASCCATAAAVRWYGSRCAG